MRIMRSSVPFDRDAWLDERTRGIGGSEVASLFSLDPAKCAHRPRSEYELWRAKRAPGGVRPQADSGPAARGRLLERAVLDFLDEQHGPSLRQGTDYRIPITLADNPLCGSPDGLIVDADGEIIEGREAKTAVGRIAALYGEPGSDEVPQDHAIQCHAYMALTGAKRWRLGLLTSAGGFTFASYLIQRDESICEAILARCREWWNAHVIGDAEPHMTDVERGDRAASLFPVPLDKWLEADPATDSEIIEQQLVQWDIEETRSELDRLKEKSDRFEGRMKALIGKYTGIRSSVGSIEFKATRAGRKLRYRWNDEE